MERKKIEKNLKDWANSLGFCLPSGSTLPPEYFAALGATPHRRQLWETVVEKVQPRQKIERMRKEILAARLKGFLGKFGGKEDRFDLWERRKKLETDVREKRSEVLKLEKSILTKSSDLVLEICKLAEVEKQCEEQKEKILVLMLYAQRQRKIMKELELNTKCSDSQVLDSVYQKLDNLKKEMFSLEEWKNSCENFKVPSSGNEENLWEDIIKFKKAFHKKFEGLLEEVKLNEKSFLRKKMLQVEDKLNSSLAELKQKMTEEALEVMVNTKEGKVLNLRIQELMKRLKEIYRKIESFNDGSFKSCPEKDKCLEMFINHAMVLSWKSYKDFLEDELVKFEGGTGKKSEDPHKKFQLKLKSLEAVNDEIEALKLEKEEMSKDITTHYEKLEILMRSLKEENKEDAFRKMIEESVGSLKSALEKQIPAFLQTPLDAFRKTETSSGRISFECESLGHCLNNYGGEWREFFTALLIPPTRNVSKILEELEKRKKVVAEGKELVAGWETLSQLQKNIQSYLSSIKMDSKLWEKNFKDADGILWKISFKSEQIYPEIEFLKKIVSNWVQQPYRLMIKETETLNGLTLKQYEEAYKRENH